MAKILLSSELYSHPGRLLENHLTGAAKFSGIFLEEKPPNIKEQFRDICKVIALSHDIGKATGYFQKYLNADEKEKKKLKNRPQTNHSLFSAVCAYYLCKEISRDNVILPFFAYVCVRRHHGNLIDLTDESTLFAESDLKVLHQQVESLDTKKFLILSEKLRNAGLPVDLNKSIIENWIDDLAKEFKSTKKYLRDIDNRTSNFVILNLLYSLLLDADKSDVVIRDISAFERKALFGALVDHYKEQSPFEDSPINYLREKAYQEIVNSSITLDKKIYSINLPTGLGKTLISLSFALKLRELAGFNHRIIYSLPFLSIIDQNSYVFESVLKCNGIDADSSFFLKHHHLSEMFYQKGDNEFESDEAKILIEGWNAEIIMTTFAQLFHSLISNRNKSVRKFHRFANSIIILDEIQAIPVKYWLLVKNVLLELSKVLNTYVILVTATEPLIFGEGEIEKIGNKNFYFESLDRIIIKPLLDKVMTISELSNCFDLHNEKKYLFIFNTISAAKDFYELIKNASVSKTYLSTHVAPKERLERIIKIKSGDYKVVVSTQLVEAGIDIDFDVVVRDFAPLDSINQAAGRCNRNGKHKGEVYIVFLKDANEREYSSYIYDSVLMDITRKVLSNRKEIRENEFLQLTAEYYRETDEKKSQDSSKKLLEAITKLRYDSEDDKIAITDFKLIEDDYPKRDIFVELDEEAKKNWERYQGLGAISDLFQRKKEFDSFKGDFYQYVISIPAHAKNAPPLLGELGYVSWSVLEDYYDKETGFKTKDEKSVVIW